MPLWEGVPKRERAILELLFRLGEATAREVQAELDDGTSYSAVRTFLATLETRGCVAHRVEGQRYLWFPAAEPEQEGVSMIHQAMLTFFKGSREKAMAALLGAENRPLDDGEYQRLLALIERARNKKA
jgi:BlaI family transcriptional regulator, penicillinase repressor